MAAQGLSQQFPFVSAGHFAQGCAELATLFERSRREQHDWQRVDLPTEHGATWLRVVRYLPHDPERSVQVEREPFDPEEESDEEALPQDRHGARQPHVEYSILLSPVYRVPVLYFSLRDMPAASDGSIEAVQNLMVPPQFIAQIRSIGVMGGISMTNHPVTDMPVFFVHPCNTAAALQESASESEPTPLQYMLQWFGIVGACVGLTIPIDVALQADRAS